MTFKQFLLLEGGNVFGDKTAPIKLENIEPTLNAYFAELKNLFPKKANIFNLQHFKALGSVGKKPISNDIDLGIDSKNLLDEKISENSIKQWNLDPQKVKIEYEKLTRRAISSTPEQLMMKAFLKELTLYINKNAPNLYCDEKKVTSGNIFGLYPQIDSTGKNLGIGIQIDWMIGNIEWLKFSYYSSEYPKGSNVKGLHRTQLLLATFQRAGYSFNHVSGVKDKATGKIIATNPEDALRVLTNKFKVEFTQDIVEDYFKLHKLIKILPRNDYDSIIDTYFKILDSTRVDIPEDLQDEWLARKDRLGLQGKFLPTTSALKGKLI